MPDFKARVSDSDQHARKRFDVGVSRIWKGRAGQEVPEIGIVEVMGAHRIGSFMFPVKRYVGRCTDAFECKHVLKGKIEYEIEKEKFILETGDTLFFDGRARHRLRNMGNNDAALLVVYFF